MKKKTWKKSLLSLGIALALSGTAWAMPSGGTVEMGNVAGSLPGGVIPNETTINIITPSVIQWDSFGIAHGETLNFNGAALLNRVTGGDPSEILGNLNITNSAWALINPNGIVVGPTAVINASHLLLSTLNLSNEDFMSHYGCGSGDWRMEFTTPTGRTRPAEVKIQGADIGVGKGGIQVYGGTVQLLDRVRITRNTPAGYVDDFEFIALNRKIKGTRQDVFMEGTNDNLLHIRDAGITNSSQGKNESNFFAGRIEAEDATLVHAELDHHGNPGHSGSDLHLYAVRRVSFDKTTNTGERRFGDGRIALQNVNLSSTDDIDVMSGSAHLRNCHLIAGTHIGIVNADYGVQTQDNRAAIPTQLNVFRMEGGSMQAEEDLEIMTGKAAFTNHSELAAKQGVKITVGQYVTGIEENTGRVGWDSLVADQENTVHLGDTKIKPIGPNAKVIIAGGKVDLGSSTMNGNAPVMVAVGARITRQSDGSLVTAPVKEDLYTIDKGTSNFPAHTQYIVPTIRTVPPISGPTTTTPPNTGSAVIDEGWAAMNQVLEEDAAPEKAAALVKTLNEATKGARTDESVATVMGYAKAIEGSGLSTAEKINVFRAVLDAYQPTVEESAKANATTQSEIDKKDPAPTERFTAQEPFAPNEGTSIDLREPVTGI